MINAIIPECFVDTCLINILLEIRNDSVNHGKGNSSVANKMKTTFGDKFAVGIIDGDKREIEYIKEFELTNQILKGKILLYNHPIKHHYFIQLCPESEDLICNVSRELGIDMEKEYELPNTAKGLSKLSKNINVKDDIRFVKLFKEIRRRSIEIHYEPIIKLIFWLTQLVKNNYNIDLNELKN